MQQPMEFIMQQPKNYKEFLNYVFLNFLHLSYY